MAFDIADKHLGIPKLFAVEDIVDVAKVRCLYFIDVSLMNDLS